jgi:hypothetical protein
MLSSLGVRKNVKIMHVIKIENFLLALKKITLIELTKVSMYINKIIMPPVNNKITEYIIQEDRIFLKIRPR